jgi:hypothetical protein
MLLMGEPDLPIEAFGGLKPIPRAMGQAGMTLHKGGGGGGLMAVVGVVAAIAIPFAAPAIAGAIATSAGISAATFGLSATVGATLGSAIVGAGLGAVTAAVTGGNVGRGALFGGIGGGIGGYMDATSAAAQASGTGLKVPTTTAPPPVTGTEGSLLTSTAYPSTTLQPVDYSLTGGQSFGGAGIRIPGAGADLGTTLSGTSSVGTGIDLANAGTSYSGVGLNPNATGGVGLNANTAGGVGLRMPGDVGTTTAGNFGGTNIASTYPSTAMQPVDYSLAGTQTAASTGNAGVGLRYPTDGVTSVGLRAPTGANVLGGGATQTAASTATGAGAFEKLTGALKDKFTDPKAQADMILRAAGQLAGSAIAGQGLSDEEQQLLAQQKQELEQLRTTNQELFQQKLAAAQNLLGESRYFDPEYFGGQSLKAYQTAAGRAERDVLRGISPNRSALRTGEERRFALQRSAGGQTAYLQGADVAQQNRIRTTQAGLGAFPSGGPTAALSYGNYIGQIYDAAERRRRQAAGDIGDLFGTFTGTPMANKA